MRKIINLIICIAMCLSLAACGQGTQSPGSAAPASPASSASASEAPSASAAPELKYPEKPITLLITFEAGGTTDVATRLFVKYWQENLPQNVNVINIAGAGGNVGIAEAKKQKNDGYYLVMQSGPFAMNHALGTANFSWEEFEPVSLIFESYMALCVQGNSPIKTFEDFAAEVKSRPDEFKYGVYAGSPMMSTLLALQDHLETGFHVVDIPSSKSTELLAGRVEAYSDAFAQMKPFIDSGDFHCLGVFADERLPDYPDIPTMKEFGLDYVITEQKYGIWAPKGTPEEILEYLNGTVKETYTDPAFVEELSAMCFTPIYTTRAEYTDWLSNIYTTFGEFVRDMLQ